MLAATVGAQIAAVACQGMFLAKMASSDALLGRLRAMHGTTLAHHACDLDPYLTAESAMGTRVGSDMEWLSSQADGHSKRLLCFLGWPTVDGSIEGLPDDFMSLL